MLEMNAYVRTYVGMYARMYVRIISVKWRLKFNIFVQIFLERERSAAADENETELKCLKSSFFVFRPNFFEKMIFKLSALVSCS